MISFFTAGRCRSSFSPRVLPCATFAFSSLGIPFSHGRPRFVATESTLERRIPTMAVGDEAEIRKTFAEHDVVRFADISLDTNLVHFDDEYARRMSPFPRRVVHGMMTLSLISAVIGTILPGPGSILLSHDIRYRKPVFLDEQITATARIAEIIHEKNRIIMDVACRNPSGDIVLDGKATVYFNQIFVETTKSEDEGENPRERLDSEGTKIPRGIV